MNSKDRRGPLVWVAIAGPIVLVLASARLAWDLIDISLFIGGSGGNAVLVWVSIVVALAAAVVWFLTGYLVPRRAR